MKINKQFGSRLKKLRIEAGLSISQVAKLAGVSISYISKVEHSTLAPPSANTIVRIALILNADNKELLNLANKIRYTDFQKIREEMPLVLECQFAIKAGKGWILR